MKFTRIDEFIACIEQLRQPRHSLEYFKSFLSLLDNPHEKLRCIHVGGSNGKGSCIAYLRYQLMEAKYRVGCFTSPYLKSHLDRIQLNGLDIEGDVVLRYANTYFDEWMKWELSMFEIDMCMALLYFLERKVDICLFEVGMGGRLDPTNVILPLVSVITNIGKDHVKVLGNTYEKIASEKAGIIKPNIDLISGEQRLSVRRIFKKTAKRLGSNCIFLDEIKAVKREQGELSFVYRNLRIVLSTLAYYQCWNAALSVEVLLYLREQGAVKMSDEKMLLGLKKAKWEGRFEVIREKPLILLDGAHNLEGMQALCASVEDFDDLLVVFSALQDKKYLKMLACLPGVSKEIIVCKMQHERSLNKRQLKAIKNVRFMEDGKAAIAYALKNKRNTLFCGSLYFISEIRALLVDSQEI